VREAEQAHLETAYAEVDQPADWFGILIHPYGRICCTLLSLNLYMSLNFRIFSFQIGLVADYVFEFPVSFINYVDLTWWF
jgi:hypothetical protein